MSLTSLPNLIYIPIEDGYNFITGLIHMVHNTLRRIVERHINRGFTRYIGFEEGITRIQIIRIEIEILDPPEY